MSMIGRVIEEHKTNYMISSEGTEYTGVVRGKFHNAPGERTFPKVGDFVECVKTSDDQVVIEKVLPRKTEIARKAIARNARQVMVANVDVVFVVMGLDGDFNLRRLERYLLLTKQSGIETIIVLNKKDLVTNPGEYLEQVKTISPDISAYAVSAETGENMEVFTQHISEDTVSVLLGSSGAGKSTITNWLLEKNQQETNTVREDDSKGRHTTTHRQMFKLPQGGFLIDTPGMRELGLSGDEESEANVFTDIEELKLQCEFTDCDHEKSVGCAVQEAVKSGELDEKRFKSYLKLQREREYMESKNNRESAHERNQKTRKIHTNYNKIQKQKRIEKNNS